LTIAVDGNGTPYVAAETGANTDIWQHTNGSWQLIGSLTAQGLSHASMTIDKNNVVYLASRDDPNPPHRKLSVRKYDGNAWQTVGNRSFSADIVDARSISITTSPGGVPYVAYRDDAYNGGITVKKLDGNSWSTVGNEGFSNGSVILTSIVTDNAGTPYVAYSDAGNNYKATVKKFDGTAWTTVGAGGFSQATAQSLALCIDNNDTLYVVYSDGIDSKAQVQKFDGNNWVNLGTGNISSGEAHGTTIAVNSNGVPYIAYKDIANEKKAIVKLYDKNTGIWSNNLNTNDIKIFPSPASDFINISVNSAPYQFKISLLSISGTTMSEHIYPADENYLQLSTSMLAPGVYFIAIHNSEQKIIHPFVKQ
jgi:hypothetical protein